MTTVKDLVQRFAVFPVVEGSVLSGDCIIIPGEELNLDWIPMFLEEGYRFEGTRIDGYPVVLVQVSPMPVKRSPLKTGHTTKGGPVNR
ncbi:MAG: hypothetical protein NWF00_05005 [Candidatus Bathyarchaeota archaeon]|nr:hypothetical protein [Candidatus Bathyarchaeota archaeon]